MTKITALCDQPAIAQTEILVMSQLALSAMDCGFGSVQL